MDIESAVAAYNDQRKGLAATRSKVRRKQNYILGALAAALVAVAAWSYFSGNGISAMVVPMFGVPGLFIVYRRLRGSADGPGEELQRVMREGLFPALFSDVEGLRFQADTKGFFDEIPDSLKQGATKFEWGDLIEGSYQGQPIAINEVAASKKTGSGDNSKMTNVIDGLALKVGLDHPVPDLTVSIDPETIKRWIMKQLTSLGKKPFVEFQDEKFDVIYDLHCADEGFASSVFSEAGRAKFVELRGTLTNWPMQMATTGTTAYVLLNIERDLFELPSLDRPFNPATDGRRLQDDMQRILDLSTGVREFLKKTIAAA